MSNEKRYITFKCDTTHGGMIPFAQRPNDVMVVLNDGTELSLISSFNISCVCGEVPRAELTCYLKDFEAKFLQENTNLNVIIIDDERNRNGLNKAD